MKNIDLCMIVIIFILSICILYMCINNFTETFQGEQQNDQNDQNDQNEQQNDQNIVLGTDISRMCSFTPSGSTEGECIKKCIDDKDTTSCTVNDCISRCGVCEDTSLCGWLTKEFDDSDKESIETTSCKFKPYGNSKEECKNACMDSCEHGGTCNQKMCSDICNSCDNRNWCWWLTLDTAKPGKPVIFGHSELNKITIFWNELDNCKKYMIMVYEKKDPNNTLQLNTLHSSDIDETMRQGQHIKYVLDNVKNNVEYKIYVVGSNANGLSLPSNEITIEAKEEINMDILGGASDIEIENLKKIKNIKNEELNLKKASANTVEFKEFDMSPEQRKLADSLTQQVTHRRLIDDLKGKTLNITL